MRLHRTFRGLLCSAVCLATGSAQGVITTIAGTTSLLPEVQAPALSYPLRGAADIALDRGGNLFIADPRNGMVLRLDSAKGVIQRIAGNGFVGLSGDGGPAISASLSRPGGVAVDSRGNVYIADSGNNRIRIVSPSGMISTFAGTGNSGFGGDGGTALNARIGSPGQLAIDANDNLYVVQPADTAIRRITPQGMISSVASNVPGPVTNPILGSLTTVAVDPDGVVYFADNFTGRIYRIEASGAFTAVTSGLGTNALAIDSAKNLYIAGASQVTKLTPNGPITVANLGASSLAVDASGDLFLASEIIRELTAGGILIPVAGNGFPRFFGDGGQATSALLDTPAGLALDARGNLFFADQGNNRVRRVSPDGVISTVAGDGRGLFSGDGSAAAAAAILQPRSVAIDASGNLYISDQGNNRIRKVDANLIISTVAGDGNARFGGDGGQATAASLSKPSGIAIDSAGNLYIADTGNHRIRIVSVDGTIQTYAGNGIAGFSGDGAAATLANISAPSDVLVIPTGDVYIADTQNDRIRLVHGGTISTVAGNGKRGFDGDGPAIGASLNQPSGLALDAGGNLYVADTGNLRIRIISTDGTISTVAGNGQDRYAGDGGLGRRASLSHPLAVAVDAVNNVFIADTLNQRIREILATPPPLALSSSSISFSAKSGGQAPAPRVIGALTTVPGLPFATETMSDQGWLSALPVNGTLPAAIEVSADPAGLVPGTYDGLLTVAAPSASPTTQTAQVQFIVSDPGPPTRTVDPDSLSFAFVQGTPSKSRTLKVSNLGGGSLDFTVSIATGATSGWLSVTPALGSAKASTPVLLNVTADPGQLPPGTYVGTISIVTKVDAAPFTVPVTMTITAVEQTIRLSQAGLTFTAVVGGGVTPPQTFAVINAGRGLMNWSVKPSTLSGGQQWLSASPAAGATDAASLQVPSVVVSVDPSGLDPGEYYGQVAISSPTALNSPQFIAVVLNVLPAGTDPSPLLQTNQLVFTAVAGSISPGSQDVLIYNLSGSTVAYRSSSTTLDGGTWLRYLPTDANVIPNQPARLSVDVDVSQLSPGVYNGAVTLQFPKTTSKLNVLLIVIASTPSAGQSFRAAQQVCTPANLLPVFSTIASGFIVSSGWPNALTVRVLDDCANPMVSGALVVTFSSGDPPLSMDSLKDGTWTGTWKVGNASGSDVTITAVANLPEANLSGMVQIKGSLSGNQKPPSLEHGGIVNAASLSRQLPLSPGTAISIFGTGLADQEIVASGPPLQTQLGGTSVFLAGQLLPIVKVSGSRVDAIVPFGLAVNTTHQLIVSRGSTYTVPEDVALAEAQPAIYTKDLSGKGQADIRDVQGNYVEAGNPALAGDILTIACTGLGAVDRSLDAGAPAPLDPPARVVDPVSVNIGGIAANVVSAILEPGTAGRYRVVVQVPDGVTPGDAVPVVLTVAAQSSPAVTTAITAR